MSAWNHWGYEWNLLEEALKETESLPPEIAQLEIRYRLGMITTEEYNQIMQEYEQQIQALMGNAMNNANAQNTTNTI